ncbi:unnamed protein product [Paramecium sonneborni]|uniref:Uncharacterized protein n=1 Tax=Paramecium sonneborni TaxID=65129 RepID=A0A8S1QPW6_9CILI|nr:unnamed protein product [Paramecium sonneborni]
MQEEEEDGNWKLDNDDSLECFFKLMDQFHHNLAHLKIC